VIAKHEAPTVRLPQRLPSKPTGNTPRGRPVETPVTEDGEDPSVDGIPDRSEVKNTSMDFVKKLAKQAAAAKAAEESRLKLANN
jgi:hypothetical protein